VKQRNIPWLGAFIESFFVTLPFLGIINFWAIITVLYTSVRPYIVANFPWMNIQLFVCILTAIGILGMVLVYKFVLPSIWAFRGKQMFGYENSPVDKTVTNSSLESRTKKAGITVAVSGGFDPLNGLGHLTHIQEAKKLGDRLVVILSRDDQLVAKGNKASGTFYSSARDRIAIIKELKSVDEVVMNIDLDSSCAETLRMIKPDIFAKGGNYNATNLPKSEIDVCATLGIRIVFNVGDTKVTSSSELIRRSTVGQ
jgi:D-beta-D-heptose 7-phosphate kinase/D-beta-D-heptose 1-phosphate adenosyltransferase